MEYQCARSDRPSSQPDLKASQQRLEAFISTSSLHTAGTAERLTSAFSAAAPAAEDSAASNSAARAAFALAAPTFCSPSSLFPEAASARSASRRRDRATMRGLRLQYS